MPETMSLERRTLLRALRRRAGADARRRGHEGRGRARRRRSPRSTETLHAPAVREPGQPGDPPPHHRGGDLGRHRRRGRHLRRRRRHRRHDHRRGRGAQASASPASRVVAVEPADSPVLSGGAPGPHTIQGIGAGFVPGRAQHATVYDEVIDRVPTTTRSRCPGGWPARRASWSASRSGANVWAALESPRRPESAGKLIVTIALRHRRALPDHASVRGRLGLTLAESRRDRSSGWPRSGRQRRRRLRPTGTSRRSRG